MTNHEFFEILNDLDDKMVVNAKPSVDTSYDPFSDMPMKIKPVRRPLWKPFAAAAACLAAVAVGLTVFLNIGGRQDDLPLPPVTDSNIITPLDAVANGYPKEAIYQYKGDFSELEINPPIRDIGFWIYEEDYQPSFSGADLIVVGTFVDDAYQTWDPKSKETRRELRYGDYSFNKLRIEKVFKGSAEVGDEIIICDRYGIADGTLYYDQLTPMIKGDTWCYLLQRDYDKGENCYTTSLFDRFPVPGSAQPEFPYIKNKYGNVLYNMNGFGEDDDTFFDHLEKNYEYAVRMLNDDPEILKLFRFEYDGVTYNIEGSWDLPALFKITLGMPRTEVRAGDTIEAIAVIENDSVYPVDADINFTHSSGGAELKKIVDGNIIMTNSDSTGLPIVQPGETYYQKISFSTYTQSYKPEDTVIPDHVPSGKYEGKAKVGLIADDGRKWYVELGFNTYIADSRTDVDFTMDEFPGVSFNCGRTDLIASTGGKDTMLFSGVPIKNLYLIDLNGDGRRELCSSISVGSGSVDDRILAFDYANGKLYELSDRLNCDYHIEVGRDPGTGEWYANAGRYDFTRTILISTTPLTLDIMTEVKSITTEAAAVITTMKLAGSTEECEYREFSMAEFPGVEFVCRNENIYVNGSNVNPVYCNYDALYIADLNGDNKREILAVCRGNTDRTWVFIYDHVNKEWYHTDFAVSDSCSLDQDGEGIFLVRNGRREDEKLRLAALGVETIRDDKTDRGSFKLPEISDSYEFTVGDSGVSIRRGDGKTEEVLSFNGNALTKLYLCDISGDGRREIAAEGMTASSEPYIQVYDLMTSRLYYYDLSERNTLDIRGTRPYIGLRRADDSVILFKELSLDIFFLDIDSGNMKYLFIPEAEIVYDDNVHTDSFTIPNCDGCEFVIEDGDITLYEDGGEPRKLFGSDEVKKVYLYDTECDLEPEIYAVVRRKGESKTVVCVVYKDKAGDIRTSFTESVGGDRDMDLFVDKKYIRYKDTAAG